MNPFLYLNTLLSLFWIQTDSLCLLWHLSKLFGPFSHFDPSPKHALSFSKFSLLHLVLAEGFPARKSNNHVPGTCCVSSWSITIVKLRTYRYFFIVPNRKIMIHRQNLKGPICSPYRKQEENIQQETSLSLSLPWLSMTSEKASCVSISPPLQIHRKKWIQIMGFCYTHGSFT